MRASVGSRSGTEVESPAPRGVPRRYGLGALFVWTLLFSLLFLSTRALDLPWPVVAAISGFLVLIALAQWYFGEGRRARLTSVVVGAVYFPISVVIGLGPQDVFVFGMSSRILALQGALIMAVCVLVGAVLGYLAGTLVAGVFLVAYWIDRAFANWRRQGSEVD